jgi:hypothetical protein
MLEDIFHVGGIIVAIIVVAVLGIGLLCLPINYYSEVSNIQAFNSVEETVQIARSKGKLTEFERAALTQKIVGWNAWLRKAQYWNNTTFDWYIPDEVDNLEPLE